MRLCPLYQAPRSPNPNTTNLRSYLRLIQPMRSPSMEFVRIGSGSSEAYRREFYGDGGYCMLTPPPLESSSTQSGSIDSSKAPIAISLGIWESSPWDLEMADKGYRVLEFDASINHSPYPDHPNIHFTKLFVGAQDTPDTISFARLMSEVDINPSAHNILQCDIENAEWEILDSIDLGLLEHFSQVIFEFHACNPDDEQGAKLRLRVLEKLRAHFTPIHIHYNNNGDVMIGVIDSEALIFCSLLEISYLRNDLLPKDAMPVYGYALTNLDMPCVPNKPEIPVIFPKSLESTD